MIRSDLRIEAAASLGLTMTQVVDVTSWFELKGSGKNGCMNQVSLHTHQIYMVRVGSVRPEAIIERFDGMGAIPLSAEKFHSSAVLGNTKAVSCLRKHLSQEIMRIDNLGLVSMDHLASPTVVRRFGCRAGASCCAYIPRHVSTLDAELSLFTAGNLFSEYPNMS